MKIVHLIQRYQPAIGGSETWCREVARHQARCGHQVRVLTFDIVREQEFWQEPEGDGSGFRLGRLDLDEGVEVRRYRRSLPVWTMHHVLFRFILDRLLNVFFLGPHSREMMANLRTEMQWADVVHLHTLPYPHVGVGLRAARRAGVPVVITPHFHAGHKDYERPHQYRWLRRADAVVVISAHEREVLAVRGVPEEQVHVTGCGAPAAAGVAAAMTPEARQECRRRLRQEQGWSATTQVVICVARQTPEKGLETLVRAVDKMAAAGRDIGLVIVGPGFPWFDQLVAGLAPALRRRLAMLGMVDEAHKAAALAAADLFAMLSRFEAFGIVFLEAWAAGLPVVGGDAGAQPEVIGAGGATVPFGDVDATVAALARFLDHPIAAAAAVAHGSRALAERFTWERIGAAVLDVYRDVVGVPAAARLAARRQRRPLRLACASNFYPPHFQGGAELVLARQVEGLTARGYQVRVLAGRLDENRPRHTLEAGRGTPAVDWLTLHREDVSGEFGNHINAAADRAFSRLLDDWGPDLVHVHNLAGLSAGILHAAADRGLPVVMTLHDYWSICVRNILVRTDDSACSGPGMECSRCLPVVRSAVPMITPVRNGELAAALARVDLFLAPSAYLARRFVEAGVPEEKIRLLPYGVDMERFLATPQPPPSPAPFLYLGYLGVHKGVAVLLRALARPEASGVRLVLAGDGERRRELEEMGVQLGIASRVTFLGRIEPAEVPALLAASKALVLPSTWPENAPVTITEAMAAGRAVVATDIGGIPELVGHGATGILVPPGDDAALAAALAELEGDGARAAAMGQTGRAAIGELMRESVLDTLEEIYAGLVDRPRRGSAGSSRAGTTLVALAGAADIWAGADLQRLLCSAEAAAGPFALCHWQGTGGAGLHPDPASAALLLLPPGTPVETAAEAMALGVPFLALAAADSPLAVLAADSGSGVVVAGVEAAAARLAELLGDAPSRQRLGRAGRRFVKLLTSPASVAAGRRGGGGDGEELQRDGAVIAAAGHAAHPGGAGSGPQDQTGAAVQ